jgi:hypothetical protein
MMEPSTGNEGPYPALTRMAIQFFDDALEIMGDDRQAAMVASAALMAAVDKLREARERQRATRSRDRLAAR